MFQSQLGYQKKELLDMREIGAGELLIYLNIITLICLNYIKEGIEVCR